MTRIDRLRRDKQFIVRCLKVCREAIRVGFDDSKHRIDSDIILNVRFGDELKRLVLLDQEFWKGRESSVVQGLKDTLFDLSFFRAQLTVINLQLEEKTE